ncbi:MAG: hypothetical protein M0036_20020 [Desulfobacteraceae bacterium]|nr:hypothetical protein [Desulfobacteraceae bacterium]
MTVSDHLISALDATVPGGVYLCQVNERVSCGACCGLYNVADTSRDHMATMLGDRTRRFAQVPRTPEGIDGFALRNAQIESQERPFPQFHHCPFIGLIGAEHSRVGCLLHPLADGNHGVDFRGLSYYGGLACRTYFCPTTHGLAPRYKRIVRAALDDWHLYGLVVTETDLLSALLHQIEVRLGRRMEPTLFESNPAAGQALAGLMGLKLDWPHRPPQADTPCHHFFFDVSYTKPVIDYLSLGVAASPYNPILRELVSAFDSVATLRRAEQAIDQKIGAVVAALAIC